MKRALKITLITVPVVLLVSACLAALAFFVYMQDKLPKRSGALTLQHLQAPVNVHYDDRGVPHLRAQNQADLYRALGYVHAQDRLFQMEMARRLARGELAEILGPKLVNVDRLFRTLGLRAHAEAHVARMDQRSAPWQSLGAYLDGVNQYVATGPTPLEFEILGIPKKPFSATDVMAITGYLAYSFAAAFKTEPVLTYVRDQLGPEHLRIFDIGWHPLGVVGAQAERVSLRPRVTEQQDSLAHLSGLAALSQQAQDLVGLPLLEGSNAWALSGQHTTSGKPLLAGDPHIGFSVPAVWYEAHLSAPDFELYGHHQALNPFALLGHNRSFGWSLTMFQNDDMDLVAEKINPSNPAQVWHRGQWVELQKREEIITVKDAAPIRMTVRLSPNGPILNDIMADSLGQPRPPTTEQPLIALWWAFLQTDNPIMEAFYELNRADTLDKARTAASKVHAPGLNIVWANAAGDIGWWAAARLPQRPPQVNPTFILDAASGEADKPGYYRFADNPQEENPTRGYIVSANHQPAPRSGVPVAGYYNLPDRARRLDQMLRTSDQKWHLLNSQTLQLDTATAYGQRVLAPLLPVLREMVSDPKEKALVEHLAGWSGQHGLTDVMPTVFHQLIYELARAALADELGEAQFANLLDTRALDHALPRLAADANSPWWDRRGTPAIETRRDIVRRAWQATMKHLRDILGDTPAEWVWGKVHTLTHGHPLGRQKPLNLLFDVGPFRAPGGREVPNNLSYSLGPAPWSVSYGPSTRRLIDFGAPEKSLGINPVGQSGVLFDAHYADQAEDFIAGRYYWQYMDKEDIAAHQKSRLRLQPAR